MIKWFALLVVAALCRLELQHLVDLAGDLHVTIPQYRMHSEGFLSDIAEVHNEAYLSKHISFDKAKPHVSRLEGLLAEIAQETHDKKAFDDLHITSALIAGGTNVEAPALDKSLYTTMPLRPTKQFQLSSSN